MPLALGEEVSETADNFVSRTLNFVTPAAAGVRVVVGVWLYTCLLYTSDAADE